MAEEEGGMEKEEEHELGMINKKVNYDSQISGFVSKKKIKKLTGVKTRAHVVATG
ncbi:hypothetical protein HS088_TW08G00656 [Tripterygium wilfordii]|uniref:Uncharacterized protein n=1 Tax=Tripterygium wilfordii TaxID=458696 RepID=A0A7J7DCP0_TRIWF|nr:hypothetical protein HS088_TW08G00656 [Tripterygium wilfordii]